MKSSRLHIPFYLVAFSFFLISCSTSKKVESPQISSESKPKVVIEKSAAIIGGQTALQQKLVYPDEARRDGVETVLDAKVLVDQNGKIEQVSFDRETEYNFEEAAENALYQVEFTPGERNGQAVRMFVTIPVEFKLD